MDTYIQSKLREMNGQPEMFTLPRESQRDLRFQGWLIADESPLNPHEQPEQNGRLYLTQSGKLIFWLRQTNFAHNIPDNTYTVYISHSVDELITTMGTGWLAKQIYEIAGVDCVEEVS